MVRSTGGLEGVMNFSYNVVFALVTLGIIVEAAVIREDGCALSIDYANGDLKEPQPLVLNAGKKGLDFLLPINNSRVLKLKTGQTILLACPGKGNYVSGINGSKNLNEIEARCLRGKTFDSQSNRFNFTSVTCKYLPKHVARRTTKRCNGNDTHIEIGYPLKTDFLKTIDICRNDQTLMTVWTKFRLTTKISSFQSSYPRPQKWETGDFYKNYNLQNLYKLTTQMKTIETLVGSKELAKKYIQGNANLFMARGHLTAKADFIYGSAQMSTFWYLNAAPQWHTFNAGNWNSLESNVRKFVGNRTSDLEVYTGIHGQMSLTDINGNKVPIYLHVNGTKRAFPVPKFYWKVIHDPLSKKATAFIGTNDPWAEKITSDLFICDNVADKIKWLTWKPNSIVKGISYACTLEDFRKVVPTLPQFSVNGILA